MIVKFNLYVPLLPAGRNQSSGWLSNHAHALLSSMFTDAAGCQVTTLPRLGAGTEDMWSVRPPEVPRFWDVDFPSYASGYAAFRGPGAYWVTRYQLVPAFGRPDIRKPDHDGCELRK
jgi:hypothetical protein